MSQPRPSRSLVAATRFAGDDSGEKRGLLADTGPTAGASGGIGAANWVAISAMSLPLRAARRVKRRRRMAKGGL